MTSNQRQKRSTARTRQLIADAFDVPIRLLGYGRIHSARRRRVQTEMRRIQRRAGRKRPG